MKAVELREGKCYNGYRTYEYQVATAENGKKFERIKTYRRNIYGVGWGWFWESWRPARFADVTQTEVVPDGHKRLRLPKW